MTEELRDWPYLRAGVERIRAFAKARGLKTLPASRLGRYCRTVDDHHAGRQVYPTDLSRAVVELAQFIRIVDQLSDDPKLEETLRRALKGDPHPWKQATQEAQPWDYQAELFLAASLRSAGIEARLEEPDLRATVAGTELAIAVKRPHRTDSISPNIEAAASQIERSGMPGLIALDITPTLLEGDGLLLVTIIENATPKQATEIQTSKWLERNADAIRREIFKNENARSIVGMLTFAIVPMVKGRSQLAGCGIDLITHTIRPQGLPFESQLMAIGLALSRAADPIGEMVQGSPLGVAEPLD